MAVNDLPSLGVDSGPETQANVGVEEFSGGRRINEAMPMILHLGSDDLVELDRYLRGTGMDGVRQVGGGLKMPDVMILNASQQPFLSKAL